MGRIINNVKHQPNQSPLEDLCCEIYQGDYVLVIGNDVILKSGLEGGNNNKSFIDYHFEEYLKENNINIEYIEERKDKLSEFLRTQWVYDIDSEINQDLIGLLQTKCFRVVLTTTYDGYLETLMRSIWGDELRVINIYDNRDKSIFGTYTEFDIIPPTLVYAFGKADTSIAKYVYTEDNAIELIATRWLESTKRPNDLINYIRTKKVLGIGCKLDDWEFRFFWYSLRQDLSKLQGNVAISLDTENSESDRKLSQYLSRKKVYDKGDSREFLHKIQKQLNEPNDFVYSLLQNRLKRGGVFISYASEDFNITCQIYKFLQESGCKVWFDNNQLLGGDLYDGRISAAINECRYFVPILSAQTMSDIKSGKERYYMKEWRQVADNKECKITPVALYGFDIKQYRDLLPLHFKDRSIISWAENGPARLLEAIKYHI